MEQYRGIIFIVIISIFASIFTAWMNGMLQQTSFSDWSDDAEYYNARALSLIHTGSLGEEQALFRRPPGYSFFLAVAYAVFGEHIAVIWILQEVLFAFSLLSLWRISLQFLAGWRALAPPLFSGLYWGIHFYVFQIGAEVLAAFFLLLFVFLLMRYRERHRVVFLIICGVVGGALALIKPVFLYAAVLLFGGAAYEMRNGYKAWLHAAAAFALVCLFVGGWTVRTYALFGETQTERVGHIIYTRALYGSLSWREIGTHVVASLTGDYVADQIFAGYGSNPVSQRLGSKRVHAMAQLREQDFTLAEAEAGLLRQGMTLIAQHPVKFFAGVIPLLLDLNTPENNRGFPVTRMFVGTRDSVASFLKVSILMTIRIAWFFVLGFSVAGFWLLMRGSLRAAWPILLLIVFFNGIHALLIFPAEPRFIMPVLPFYFLCAAVGVQRLLTRVTTTYRVKNV